MTSCDVAIVGGGFSGAMVAVNLARLAGLECSVRTFEPGELGRGAAYGTRCPAHLLNTRAAAMSAFADDPAHFVRWLGGRASPEAFVARGLYGDYVAELAARAFERPRFARIRERVVSITRSGSQYALRTASGATFAARAVVLATGNAPPDDAALPAAVVGHAGYVADPWRFDYGTAAGDVLVIGSGLTALDVLLALEAAGHRGNLFVVSRRGRFPETHARGVLPPDVTPVLETADARALLRSFRCRIRDARARGVDWRSVVDAVRPECETLWKHLAPKERRRFDRHLRCRWERHRHRAPLQTDAVRLRYLAAGRLAVYAGYVAAAAEGFVTIGTVRGTHVVRPRWIVNCTGPGRRRVFGDPLLGQMLADDLATPEPLGLGIRVDAGLGVVGRRGDRVPGLWAVGPLARGSRFEATAVPELRTMAQEVAVRALSDLKRPDLSAGASRTRRLYSR